MISIPEKIHNLFFLIGLVLIGYSQIKTEETLKQSNDNIEHILSKTDSITYSLVRIEYKINKKANFILNTSRSLAQYYNVRNPVSDNDPGISFNRIRNGNKNEIFVSDSIQTMWQVYKNLKFEQEILNHKQISYIELVEHDQKYRTLRLKQFSIGRNLGISMFLTGLCLWYFADPKIKNSRMVKQNEKLYKSCQSCGKEFSSMLGYGTNKDKSFNYAFCSGCYENGGFRNPDLTREEYRETYMNFYKNRGFTTRLRAVIKFYSLERWQS